MNFEEVLTCLKNPEKLKEFISRLKNAGKNSKPFFNVQNAMVELRMNRFPRGIHQKTIIQHTLRFCDSWESFHEIRLVCKSWKDAVDTIRFDRFVDTKFFRLYCEDGVLPAGCDKYLSLFKRVNIPMSLIDSEDGSHNIFLILKNMKKLNEIGFEFMLNYYREFKTDRFIFQMLQNSCETLQVVDLPKCKMPDVSFPKLRELCIMYQIQLHEFQINFPKMLENMPNLENILFCIRQPYCEHLGQYIYENYRKHCIIGTFGENMLNMVPTKILEDVWMLEVSLHNQKYISALEYLEVTIEDPENPMDNNWDRYQEYFDQCRNLKEIEFVYDWKKNFITEILPNISEENQKIWKERISYFQARRIRLVNIGDIKNNEALRSKLEKEEGISWRFHFYTQ